VGGQLAGVQPGAQRELAGAQHLGGLHALDRIELGLDHAHQVVGDVVGGQRVAVEAHVHASVVCPICTVSTGCWACGGSWFFTEPTWVLISVSARLAS
jgi:hypothetical protein